MKFITWIILFPFLACASYAVDIKKEGLIPSYNPTELNLLFFLPYDPTIILIGDRLSDVSLILAKQVECANVYGFTTDAADFETLSRLGKQRPNLRAHFGLLNDLRDGSQLFYSTLPHDIPNENYYHFSGSCLKPTDARRPFLFGPSYKVPTFNFSKFCKSHEIRKIHFIQMDCGGNELNTLKSIQEYLKEAIVVNLKTYHQEIRQGISPFRHIHKLMTSLGYELFSHYIYDNVIGDACYVKSKYITAVFRSKEI
ncbi:MAG TPA: FkbM family methyltransferase [Rhabdochlamydiaceae bacterium]|jgi:hypothetical protein|nr:FkbM family methyltransferase [Rhabdochlamydiaceae bacterium]